MTTNPVTPKPFLASLVDKPVLVKLKWGVSYAGILVSVDAYLNFQLVQAVEHELNQKPNKLGEIFIRCNNVLYARALLPEEEEQYKLLTGDAPAAAAAAAGGAAAPPVAT